MIIAEAIAALTLISVAIMLWTIAFIMLKDVITETRQRKQRK